MWIKILIITGCILLYLFLWALTAALVRKYMDVETDGNAFAIGLIVPVFLPVGIAYFMYKKIMLWMK